MNFRTTVFLFALLLCAGTLALVIHYRQEHQPAETKDEHKLVDLEEKDLSKIVVTPAGGKRMVLEKSGMEWKLAEPISAPADTFAVDSLVSALTGLRARERSAVLALRPSRHARCCRERRSPIGDATVARLKKAVRRADRALAHPATQARRRATVVNEAKVQQATASSATGKN